ncbi:MAG: hypothetical protein KAI79_03495 [Bacteroidales bacterium]|nr:hypothetical protein [Bacteroidales bacterium]
MSFRFKLLLSSIALPFLLFPLMAIFFGENSLDVFLIPIFLSFFFMIFSLIFYKMDTKNNKKRLEEYKKTHSVEGNDILEATSNRFFRKAGFKNYNVKPAKVKFSNLSMSSKIFTLITIGYSLYIMISLAIPEFKNLVERQYEIQQMELEYNQQVKEREDRILKYIEKGYIKK